MYISQIVCLCSCNRLYLSTSGVGGDWRKGRGSYSIVTVIWLHRAWYLVQALICEQWEGGGGERVKERRWRGGRGEKESTEQ